MENKIRPRGGSRATHEDEAAVDGVTIQLAPELEMTDQEFVEVDGYLPELAAALNIHVPAEGPWVLREGSSSLSPRLVGNPGVGKTELGLEVARRVNRGRTDADRVPVYLMQGHEELTPEDLALLLVPDPHRTLRKGPGFIFRASPLATALLVGGIVLFDEIGRVPERALSPLSSVLDGRRALFSASAGVWIKPRDEAARRRFRFIATMNPTNGVGVGALPDFIAQRTLPILKIRALSMSSDEDRRKLLNIVSRHARLTDAQLAGFEKWAKVWGREISSRIAIALARYAHDWLVPQDEDAMFAALNRAQDKVIG